MELRTLRAFVEVVRQGGFSQAAKTVFATQSTVSKAVKQLEDEVGARLLDRVGHRSKLTSAGEVVYRRALTMLAERDDLNAELDELRGLKRGTLRLGMPPIAGSIMFAPVFAEYHQRYPGIDIRLTERGGDSLKEILLAGEVDLASVLLPVSEEFDWQEGRNEPLMAVLAADHPLAALDSVDLDQLKTLPFILFETGFSLNRIVLDCCKQHGFEPEVVVRSGQIDFIVELVGAGLGVAFLPRIIAERRPNPRVRYVRLTEPGTAWHMAMIWRRNAYLSQAAKVWLDLAREVHAREQTHSTQH
jgi:DNA-binding transcriptional LysR family regulator